MEKRGDQPSLEISEELEELGKEMSKGGADELPKSSTLVRGMEG